MNRGFTLIEILISTGILVTGLVAVASLFAYTSTTNLTTQQRTTANAILYDKMESFKSTALTSAGWIPGGTLTPQSPQPGYFDYVTVNSDGTIRTSTTDPRFTFMRLWHITGSDPRTVTIVVYAQRAGVTRRRLELIRATAVVGSKF